ncbi:MAG: DNA polymerase, partial [Deinococcales bacterium]
MEFYGVVLDGAVFESLSAEMSQKLSDLEYQVREIADNPLLNLNSRDQLATLLFETLKLRAGKRTSTGKQSTAVAVLEQLRDAHPVVNLILDYRELAKLRSTYLEPLPKMVNSKTGRLHTTFSQTTAVTGRLSSLNPNLQNIPIRSDIGRQIRKGFIAAEGYKLLVADYSQIELRVLAHIADEPALIAAFQKGADIHASTAASIYGVPLNEVQSGMRRIAKTINFGVLYGMGAHRLSRELSIDYAEAELFIKSYFANYPNIQNYIDRTLSQAREYGYVESLLGRRRKIPDILSSNRNVREYAERTAYNMPIQGSAADIMKLAMLALHPQLKEHGAKMLLQVHDELIFEVPEDKLDPVR